MTNRFGRAIRNTLLTAESREWLVNNEIGGYASFQRYWNDTKGYCYDVSNTANGPDEALRPHQIFAVALPHIAKRRFLYTEKYVASPIQRDGAYYQSTVGGCLLGP